MRRRYRRFKRWDSPGGHQLPIMEDIRHLAVPPRIGNAGVWWRISWIRVLKNYPSFAKHQNGRHVGRRRIVRGLK